VNAADIILHYGSYSLIVTSLAAYAVKFHVTFTDSVSWQN